MEGMGVCKEKAICDDVQQAALQICSARKPSDHGFPRNPLLINSQHQYVFKGQVLFGLSNHERIYKHLQILPDQT